MARSGEPFLSVVNPYATSSRIVWEDCQNTSTAIVGGTQFMGTTRHATTPAQAAFKKAATMVGL